MYYHFISTCRLNFPTDPFFSSFKKESQGHTHRSDAAAIDGAADSSAIIIVDRHCRLTSDRLPLATLHLQPYTPYAPRLFVVCSSDLDRPSSIPVIHLVDVIRTRRSTRFHRPRSIDRSMETDRCAPDHEHCRPRSLALPPPPSTSS